MARAGRVGEGADGLGRLVLVSGEQVVEARVADGLHEPFSRRRGQSPVAAGPPHSHVGPRKTVQGVEA